MMKWSDAEPYYRERMNAAVEYKLRGSRECDGGPVGYTADIVLARLIGVEDQVVDDTLRLDRARPEWSTPIPQRVSARMLYETPDPTMMTLRAARYVLQSGWAEMAVDYSQHDEWPSGVEPGPQYLVRVLFVRYRRRLG